jgi:hypothetical protein
LLTVNALAGADLEFPLSRHNLSISTRDENAGVQAGLVMSLDDISAEDLSRAHTTIVWTLRTWETIDWPAIRSVGHIKECVFLLKTEPRLMFLVCLHELGGLVAVVELVRGSIGIPTFGQDQDVWDTTKRIREDSNRPEIDIRVVAWSLSSRGAIEVPFWKVFYLVLFTILWQFR